MGSSEKSPVIRVLGSISGERGAGSTMIPEREGLEPAFGCLDAHERYSRVSITPFELMSKAGTLLPLDADSATSQFPSGASIVPLTEPWPFR